MKGYLRRLFFDFRILPIYPILLLLFIYEDVFLFRQAVFTHDTIHWYGAFNYFVLCLARAVIPMWDPYSLTGVPYYFSQNAVGALDPTVVILIPLVRWFHLSVLDLYHWHYLGRFIIFYVGCYALFLYISKCKWSALFGSTLVLLILAPNAFWQHGAIVMISYASFSTLFLLQTLSPKGETSRRQRGFSFVAFCYCLGLSFHLYLPSYILIYLSVVPLYLLFARKIGFIELVKNVAEIGKAKTAL
ncbi:MAG: hypothetical protein HY537_15855, partial [Deltaproteobacteria bacterium]|nr:hypothetical protein [Deltaproteobacteria bacterium]